MKKSKVLVPALALLCMSTAATVTGTVAWFAANNSVSATDMRITAKSDATDLQINTVAKATTAKAWSSSINGGITATLLPIAHNGTSDSPAWSQSAIETKTVWYYGYSSAVDSATLASATKVQLTNSDTLLDVYVVKTSFYFRLAANTDKKGTNLRVKSIDLPDDTGITCIVSGADGMQEFTEDYDSTETGADAATPLVSEVDYVANDGTSTYKVDVYFYVNGNDSHVYTDNITNLSGDTDISFEITSTLRS